MIQNNMPLRAGDVRRAAATRHSSSLDRRVPKDAIVAVTLEKKPGAATPHGKILLHSQST